MDRLNKENVFRKGAVLLFWIILWYLLALLVDNEILMVTPGKAVVRLCQLCGSGAFWITVLSSLGRIGMGFLLGVSVGLLLAILSGRFAILEELLKPFMTLCKSVPVASFVVLFLIWWGSAYLAVAICFLIVLPNIYINTLEGIRSTDKKLLEMAKVFRVSLGNRFLYIYRPALKPFLNSSLKLSLGMCWKSGVAAEVIGTPMHSIGEQLYFSKIHLDTAGVFAWTAVIILLSICFEKLILRLTEKFFAWEPSQKHTFGREGGSGRAHVLGRKRDSGRAHSSDGKNTAVSERTGIEIRELYKSFGEERLFDDFSRKYNDGEVYYLTEPSGSGKTTLIRMLCGLESPDAGNILMKKDRCSVMFQEDRLCEEYNPVRNVEIAVGNPGKSEEALLELLEPEALKKPCSQLSGGMKRRVALVRAMEAQGNYVFLDEPFTGMDADTRVKAEEYIKRKQQGRLLIIATHI